MTNSKQFKNTLKETYPEELKFKKKNANYNVTKLLGLNITIKER